jgi:hypothetical protein
MIEQAGLSIAISEGAGLRIADCPETFSPAVNLALIFIISFSTHFAGEMQGLRTVHISGVFGMCNLVVMVPSIAEKWVPSSDKIYTYLRQPTIQCGRFYLLLEKVGKGYRYPYSWQKIGTDDP